MNILFEKIKRSVRFYYYKQKNGWTFPANVTHISGGKMAQGSHEPKVSNIVSQKLNNGDIFVDIGANVGYFSRLASNIIGREGKIYAFEVEPENYYALLQNTNGYANINTLNFALSDENSFISVNHSSHASCHSLVNTGNHLDGQHFSAPTITLDHFWKFYLNKTSIDLLKIDVEGAELMVLNGMDRILEEKIVDTMIIELLPDIIKNAGFSIDDYYHKIAPFFSISIIDNQYQSIVENGTIDSITDFKTVSNYLLTQNGAVNINLLCERK